MNIAYNAAIVTQDKIANESRIDSMICIIFSLFGFASDSTDALRRRVRYLPRFTNHPFVHRLLRARVKHVAPVNRAKLFLHLLFEVCEFVIHLE